MTRKIQELGALAMVAVALVVVTLLALRGDEQAAGSLFSILGAGTGYFLRGRVEPIK